jgi:hypothetical protein
MALTSTIVLDLVGATQTLNYLEGATLVDQITYSSNTITFSTITAFNLVKSDIILYNAFFQTYFTALQLNFPIVNKSNNGIWPNCNFQNSITFAGVTHINYVQTSNSSNVVTINYVPTAGAGGFSARSSITISLQELFMMQIMLAQYSNQVSLH